MKHSTVRRRATFVALPIACLLTGAVVWNASSAAFTDTTDNTGNAWSTGTVDITDDDAGAARFNVSGLTANSTDTRCITVTYNGSLAASVKLYGAASGTGLANYLDLVIEEGDGGSFASCTGFVATSTVFTGTLSTFAANSTNFATGVGTFAPTGSAQNKTYRITYTVQDNNAAQGLSAGGTFTWEAQG